MKLKSRNILHIPKIKRKGIYTFTLFFISITLMFVSCGIYSFTGASISPEAKTVSIEYFKNNASVVNPILSQTLTEALKDKFLNQTSLQLTEEDGDLQFEGTITAYQTVPQAITSNQTAALNRLSVTVRVNYVNKFDESKNFETSFTRYVDYDSSISLSSIEASLIEEIVENLVLDIFNQAVVNW
ncbi:MAG: LptE family protein [Bacteroidales bacterium]|jgi:hypothetical protein